MRVVFEQEDEASPIISVYENKDKNVFIGNVSQDNDFDSICIAFDPDEAIQFAKYVLKIAKQIKSNG